MRQILDWLMYVSKVLDDEFWNRAFKVEVLELGLETLAVTVTRMCQMYYGLREDIAWCRNADEKLCDRLLENIASSGNFGCNNGTGKKVESIMVSFRQEGIFRHIQKAGEYNWKACQQHAWLRPFAWVYQIGRYGRQVIGSGRSGDKLKEDVRRSSERYELLKDLGV